MKYVEPIDVEIMSDDPSDAIIDDPVGNIKQQGIESENADWSKYQKAMLEGDVDALESLRLKNPEDARFNIHLQIIEAQPEQEKTFKQAQAEHEKTLRAMNFDGIPQFRKLLDSGNKKKAVEYINSSIRKDHPLRNAMIRMVDFM